MPSTRQLSLNDFVFSPVSFADPEGRLAGRAFVHGKGDEAGLQAHGQARNVVDGDAAVDSIQTPDNLIYQRQSDALAAVLGMDDDKRLLSPVVGHSHQADESP